MQVSKGFCNWKNATAQFQKHQESATHKQAVEVMIVLPSATKDVSELLVTQLAKEKEHNRRMFLKIVSSIRFLSRQGMAFRGDRNDEDSNFLQLLRLKAVQIYWSG